MAKVVSAEILNLEDPVFSLLAQYLAGKSSDSPEAEFVRDMSEKAGIESLILAGGGLARRLARDRHTNYGGNFSHRTGAMFDEYNDLAAQSNAVTESIREKMNQDPAYAAALDHIQTIILRAADQKWGVDASTKMARIAEGFPLILQEVCARPY